MPEVKDLDTSKWVNPYLDNYEYLANAFVETPTIASIRQSLNSLGYDVNTQADRVNSIINVLILSNEWDVDSAEAMMVALEDDYISELEVLTLLGVETFTKEEQAALDQLERDSKDEFEDVMPPIIVGLKEPEKEANWIEKTADFLWWSPLERMLADLSLDIGERLEKFIANAIGVEREK